MNPGFWLGLGAVAGSLCGAVCVIVHIKRHRREIDAHLIGPVLIAFISGMGAIAAVRSGLLPFVTECFEDGDVSAIVVGAASLFLMAVVGIATSLRRKAD